MPTSQPQHHVTVLGRECVLEIEGQVVDGASDVSVRETIVEIDATGFNHQTASSIVVSRSHEIQLTLPDMKSARELYKRRWAKSSVGRFWLPLAVDVRLSGGLIEIEGKFTIHEIDADELLDGAVIPRIALRSWGHADPTYSDAKI